LARHFPGVDIPRSALEEVFIAGMVAVVAPSAVWLHGWQKHEARASEAAERADTALDELALAAAAPSADGPALGPGLDALPDLEDLDESEVAAAADLEDLDESEVLDAAELEDADLDAAELEDVDESEALDAAELDELGAEDRDDEELLARLPDSNSPGREG